jgi:hypothetical protein
MMILEQEKIADVAVVVVVAVKVDQIRQRHRMRIQRRHQLMIQKSPQHIDVDVAVERQEMALLLVKPLKKMA